MREKHSKLLFAAMSLDARNSITLNRTPKSGYFLRQLAFQTRLFSPTAPPILYSPSGGIPLSCCLDLSRFSLQTAHVIYSLPFSLYPCISTSQPGVSAIAGLWNVTFVVREPTRGMRIVVAVSACKESEPPFSTSHGSTHVSNLHQG